MTTPSLVLGSVWGSHLLLYKAEGQGPALTIALLQGSAYLASCCWEPEERLLPAQANYQKSKRATAKTNKPFHAWPQKEGSG